METTKKEHIDHEPSEIESIEARIAELEEYRTSLNSLSINSRKKI